MRWEEAWRPGTGHCDLLQMGQGRSSGRQCGMKGLRPEAAHGAVPERRQEAGRGWCKHRGRTQDEGMHGWLGACVMFI